MRKENKEMGAFFGKWVQARLRFAPLVPVPIFRLCQFPFSFVIFYNTL